MGASRNAVAIDSSQSARSTSVTCVVVGSTASWERGRPAMSPGTYPIQKACLDFWASAYQAIDD